MIIVAQLLQKLSTKAKGNCGKLLQVVKNPVIQYLPVNCLKIGELIYFERLINL